MLRKVLLQHINLLYLQVLVNVKLIISDGLLRFKEAVPPGTSAGVVVELQIPHPAPPLDQSASVACPNEFGEGAVNITPLLKVNGVTGTLYPPPAEGLLAPVGTPSKDSVMAPSQCRYRYTLPEIFKPR